MSCYTLFIMHLNFFFLFNVLHHKNTLPGYQVAMPEQAPSAPVPVDFLVAQKTRVLIITGPNTGGKTICLKTVGLAAMMAKSGLFNFNAILIHL